MNLWQFHAVVCCEAETPISLQSASHAGTEEGQSVFFPQRFVISHLPSVELSRHLNQPSSRASGEKRDCGIELPFCHKALGPACIALPASSGKQGSFLVPARIGCS